MYDFPADVRSNLLVFHASLPIGDDIFARGALKSLHSLGYGKEKISTEYELLKFLRETRMEMKKAYAGAKYEESLKAAKIGLEVAPFSREFQVHKAKCFIRLNMPVRNSNLKTCYHIVKTQYSNLFPDSCEGNH